MLWFEATNVAEDVFIFSSPFRPDIITFPIKIHSNVFSIYFKIFNKSPPKYLTPHTLLGEILSPYLQQVTT